MRKIILSLVLILCAGVAYANPDQLYRDGKFEEARDAYGQLDMDNPQQVRYRYNRGCAAYKAGDMEGAVGAFSSTIRRSEDNSELQYKSLFNLGNTAFQQQDFKSAIEYYKQAYAIKQDADLMYNLELALRKLKEQSDQEQEGESSDKQDQSQEQQSEKQNQDQSGEQEDSQSQGENQEGQQQEQPGEQQQEGQQPEQQAAFDQQQAEALLDNMQEDRQQFMRYNIPSDKGVGSGKAW